jgi:HEAT repeat protein
MMKLPLEMPWMDSATLHRLARVTPEEFAEFWHAYSPLLDALSRPDDRGTRECWEAFALLDGDRAEWLLGFLVNQLRHREREVRLAAVETLGRLGDSRALHALTERLADRDDTLRLAVIAALCTLGDPDALPVLYPLLQARSARIRQAVAGACLALGDYEAPLRPLLELLHCGDGTARRQAAVSLGWPGNGAAVSTLLSVLLDRVPAVRAEAARSLGIIGDRAAVPLLMRGLHDRDATVCQRAAEALALIGDLRALEPLYLLADAGDAAVREIALQALAQFPRRTGESRTV